MKHWIKRIKAVFDGSAWLLMLPAGVALFAIDPSMLLTLVEWTAFALCIAGLACVMSLIMFPQIDLEELIEEVVQGQNKAAAILAGSLVLFLGILILSLVIWAK